MQLTLQSKKNDIKTRNTSTFCTFTPLFVQLQTALIMTTTDSLLAKYADLFQKTTTHQLTKELCQGTLADRTLFIYLAQDLQFFEEGLRLMCKISSLAPAPESLLVLARKIGFFASDENGYFRDALKLLEPQVDETSMHWLKNRLPQVESYVGQLISMTRESNWKYPQLITYLWCAEIVYWKWAHHLPKSSNLHWKYQTWIDLHDGQHFQEWCDFLRDEVNQFPLKEVEPTFEKFLKLEYEFFESCYNA